MRRGEPGALLQPGSPGRAVGTVRLLVKVCGPVYGSDHADLGRTTHDPQPLRLGGFELAEEICGVIRRHRFEDVGSPLAGERREDLDLVVLRQLFEDVGEPRYAACVVLATTRADVNGMARRQLNVRKASFAPMAEAVAQTGMEYGGITPVGLPSAWRLLVDAQVLDIEVAVIGSGVRRSKLLIPGRLAGELPGAEVLQGMAG